MIANLRDISLHKILHSDIEMLRNWRNNKKIASNMFYQKHITSQMQEKWFNSLTNNDFYFIIRTKDKAIGLINLAQIDTKKQEGQVGLFIYNEEFWGTPAPVFASLLLLQFAFEEKKLNCVWAKVRTENKQAINYNKMLGFEMVKENMQQLTFSNYKNIVKPLLQKIVQ